MNEESPLLGVGTSETLVVDTLWKPKPNRRQSRFERKTCHSIHASLKDCIEMIDRGITVFHPTDPDELVREVIEHRNGQNHAPEDDNGVDQDQNGSFSEERPAPDADEVMESEEQPVEGVSSSSPEKLGVISMAVLMFYSVSGGPFGIEATVRAGGNFYALLGFLVMPFVWSIQETLMTAELGTAFPEASGGVAWVEEAFGPVVGWMSGCLSWISGATDNSIYPVLFMDYLLQVVGNHGSNSDGSEFLPPVARFCLMTTMTIFLAYVNWRGLALVGKMSILICIVAMSPFVILIVVGSFKVDPSRWLARPNEDIDNTVNALDDDIAGGFLPNFSPGGVLWRPFLNNLFWNLNSFDSGGTFAAELDSTASFVYAMMLSVPMVVLCYFLPLLIATGSSDSEQTDWNEGYLAVINSEVVGPWLGAFTVFAAGISNIGLFQAELSGDAYQLMGMADRGYLPKIFSQRSRYGTPTYGLMLGTAVIVAMGTTDMERLIEMLNFNYAISLLLEYAAFFKLRISRPNLARPYRIPLNTLGCAILFFPTIVSTVFVLSLATYTTYCFAIGSWIVSYLLYAVRRWNERERLPNGANDYAEVGGDSFDDDTIDISVETENASGEFT